MPSQHRANPRNRHRPHQSSPFPRPTGPTAANAVVLPIDGADERAAALAQIGERLEMVLRDVAPLLQVPRQLAAEELEAVRAMLRDLLLVTTEEIARIFNVSETTVAGWCRTGELRGARSLGRGGYRVPLIAVAAFRQRPAKVTIPTEPATSATPNSPSPRERHQFRVFSEAI